MLTQTQYTTVVFTAARANAVLTQKLRSKEALGCYPDWSIASCQSLKIKSGQWSLNTHDYSSAASVDIYNQLVDIGSTWTGGIVFDPNAQLPNTTIINNNNFVGTNVVRGIIPFTNQNPVQLLNYNTTYKQLYGNNLITLDIFLNGYTEDEQTPPTIVYAISNDPTTDIISITWDYPAPVSGYILIAGVVPISGTPAAGGGGSVTFTFTEANLVDDGNGGFYLPMMLPTGKRPSYTESNNVEIKANYNNNYSPGRLYGFANNLTQTITVLVI